MLIIRLEKIVYIHFINKMNKNFIKKHIQFKKTQKLLFWILKNLQVKNWNYLKNLLEEF